MIGPKLRVSAVDLGRGGGQSLQDQSELAAGFHPSAAGYADLVASLKCQSCRKGRHAPPVCVIKLTAAREIAPYKWVHPGEEG